MLRNRSRLAVPVLSGLVLALTAEANAGFLAVVNPGFEANVLSDGDFTSSATGWTAPDGGSFNPAVAHFPGQAPEGQNVAYVSSSFNIPSSLTQNLTTVLMPGTYTLTVEVGNRLDLPFPGYTVELLAGGLILGSDTNSLSPPDGTFSTSTVLFSAAGDDPRLGQTLGIRLTSSGAQTLFDDVRLDFTAVPEPSSILMVATGALGLIGFGRVAGARRSGPGNGRANRVSPT